MFVAGLRHGVDIDHLAAISDISSSQLDKRRSVVLSTIYASGHAFVLLVPGALAVVAGERVPDTLDSFMGRVIGATLVALGLYVVYSLIRFGREARLRSRWTLVMAGLCRTLSWLRRRPEERVKVEHEHPQMHRGPHDHGHGVAAVGAAT